MTTFSALGVRKDLLKGLKELSILTPTPIQKEALTLLNQQALDLAARAQTGTGKTAAYSLPLLQRINPARKEIQGLILCPTRELGQQIARQIFKFTKYSERIFTECVYGGAKIEDQIKQLKRPTHILVATPGRLVDLIERNAVRLDGVETIILDEADEMLSMGFKKELDQVLNRLTIVKEKWLFSATMPENVNQIIRTHLSPDAARIEIKGKSGVNKNVEHQFLICSPQEKPFILIQFLGSQGRNQGIIFCKTKEAVKNLVKVVEKKGIKVDCIHGDLLQKEREKAMRSFKNKNTAVLIATDIAARGIDIHNLAYVVHYEMPSSDEYYTHRSGRTGRAGKFGVSISLVTTKEMKQIRALERKLGISYRQIRRMK